RDNDMAVHTLPIATKLTVSAPRFFPPVLRFRQTLPAPVLVIVGNPFIDFTELRQTFAMFDGQVEMPSDWTRADPKVFTPNSLKNDEIGRPLREALFTNHNADMRLEVDSLSLVGRTDIGRGIAHKITAEAPLKLENRKLKLDAATATPLMDSGAGAIGTSIKPAREDHVHPTDSSIAAGLALKVSKSGDSMSGSLLPTVTGTLNLGSATFRWGTVYTSDLSLNNGIGDWTIVEGEDDLFLYNNKRGKTYKFALTEVDPSTVPPKKV
ncbi:MAG TPA: hypothetical protein VIZ32_22970, partial [Vicinamibacterales bacterium]